MLGVEIDRALELLDALVDPALLSVEEGQVEVQTVRQGVDPDAALEVGDGLLDLARLVRGDAFVEGLLGLGREVLGIAPGLGGSCVFAVSRRWTACITSAMRNGFSRYSSMP